jgi:hypothetical protein
MKSVRTLITICLLFTAVTLFGQTENRQLMTVKVPFSFSVQDHSLPAGEYNIFTVLPERAIRITSTDGRYSAIVNTLPNYASSVSESSRLIFHRYGDEYFLAQVWTLGQTVGRNPISSQRAMEQASNGSARQTWTVLAEVKRR